MDKSLLASNEYVSIIEHNDIRKVIIPEPLELIEWGIMQAQLPVFLLTQDPQARLLDEIQVA